MKSLLCLFIIDKDPSLTGAPRTVLNLLSGLHDRGFQPILVTQRESPLTRRLRDRGVTVEILPLPSVLDVFDEGIIDYSWIEKARALGAVLSYNREITRLAAKHNADNIWARQVKGVLLTGFASLWTQRDLVWDIGVEKESTGFVYLLHTIGLLLASKVVTQARIQPQAIFGERRERLFKSKFEPINPGIEDSRRERIEEAYSSRKVDGKVKITTVGSIHPRKNQKMIIDSVAGVVNGEERVEVRIVGPFRDEGYASSLKGLTKEKGVEEYVEFLGWRDDVPEILGDSDIFVLGSQAEGVPQVIREAMYARLPVVATAVGGVPETIIQGETGFLVPPNDSEKMGAYLRTLVKDNEKRKNMGENAFQYARKKFSKESWIKSYSELLCNLG